MGNASACAGANGMCLLILAEEVQVKLASFCDKLARGGTADEFIEAACLVKEVADGALQQYHDEDVFRGLFSTLHALERMVHPTRKRQSKRGKVRNR